MLNFQELEQALGEVEFKEGIPDVKFSRVRVIFKKNSNWICVSDDCANHCLSVKEYGNNKIPSQFWTNLN